MFGLRSLTSFIARVILGYIFVMHGWQKLHTDGIGKVQKSFDAMGIPAPHAAAEYATWVEFLGGIMLVLGVLLPLVSILLIADMIGAITYAHWDHGLWSTDGGYEFPLALVAALLAVGFAQAGHAAVDHYVFRRRGRVE